MTYTYLDLDHGPGTTIRHQDIFNHRFSNITDCNFTYLIDDIDDLDLFYLIQEETNSNLNHKKDYIRFIVPAKANEHLDLFETLHFEIEDKVLYELGKKKFTLDLDDRYGVSVLDPKDEDAWLSFMLDHLDIDEAHLLPQVTDLLKEQIKKKAYTIYLIQEQGKILGSVVTHLSKGVLEIKDIITDHDDTLDAYFYQTIVAQFDQVVVLLDESHESSNLLTQLGFRPQASYSQCTKYL